MQKIGEYKNKFNIKVESVNNDKKYKNTNLIVYAKQSKKIEYGQKIKLNRKI